MVDAMTAAEEAYKNGFAEGYTRGCLDNVADAMAGTILWHYDSKPPEDQHICYICYSERGRHIIRPAVYKAKPGIFFVDSFDVGGAYASVRLSGADIEAWAEVRNPFSLRLSFDATEP